LLALLVRGSKSLNCEQNPRSFRQGRSSLQFDALPTYGPFDSFRHLITPWQGFGQAVLSTTLPTPQPDASQLKTAGDAGWGVPDFPFALRLERMGISFKQVASNWSPNRSIAPHPGVPGLLATFAGAAGSRPASGEGKLELTEASCARANMAEGIPEGFHSGSPWKGCRGRRGSVEPWHTRVD